MHFLDLDPASRTRLGEVGWAVVPVSSALPDFKENIMAPSFSGWPIFTRESQPEAVRGWDVMERGEWDRLDDRCQNESALTTSPPFRDESAW